MEKPKQFTSLKGRDKLNIGKPYSYLGGKYVT